MRKPRELREGARYHVTARANRKEMILADEAIKTLFLQVLKRAKKKYRFRIENFCVMGNHFHIIILPLHGESLSAIMQWIMSVFAMAFNRIKGFCGHVWGSRFFSRIIPNLREYLKVFEYIDANPVNSGQVDSIWEWRHGGLWHDRTGIRGIVEPEKGWVCLLFPKRIPLLLA
jgi:putative transposase